MVQKSWIVYRHISPSGKVYVGITCQKLKHRWGQDGKNYFRLRKNGKYAHPIFVKALLKYGWNNFKHDIVLEGISKSEADYAEKYLIKWYKLHGISYNCTDGGDGVIGVEFTEERCARHSMLMKKWYESHVSPMLGHHHSEEARNKIKEHHVKTRPESTKNKIRASLLGKKFSAERIANIRAAHAKERIPIVQLDMNNVLIAEYDSIMDASRATGIHNSQIVSAVKRRGSAKGYRWLNKNDYDN